MTVKIKARKVSFNELINNEQLASYISYDTLNVDFNVLYKFFDSLYNNGNEDPDKICFYVSVRITLFAKEADRDTKEKAVQYIKSETEKIIKQEIESLIDIDQARENTKMFSRFILRKDLKKAEKILKFVKEFYTQIKNMTEDQFYSQFIKEYKSYQEDDEFLIPDHDFQPKTIYLTENQTAINKGVIFPTETYSYGFKDQNGNVKIDFRYSVKTSNEESSPVIVILEDEYFHFKPKFSSIRFYEDKEEAINIVEYELKKAWRKFKRQKKQLLKNAGSDKTA